MPYNTLEKRRAYLRKWRLANPDKQLAICKRQMDQPGYKEKAKKRSHDWWQANRERHRLNVRRNYYQTIHGITLEEFDALLSAQDFHCGICGSDTPNGQGWALDHDHETGHVRGILCYKCNVGGGMYNDNPMLLQKAAEWFSKS